MAIKLADTLFKDILKNEYLKEIYSSLLKNYVFKLLGYPDKISDIDVSDALRFTDILSKSTDKQNGDIHKNIAQQMISILDYIYPGDERIRYVMASVLKSVSNYRGLQHVSTEYIGDDLLDSLYAQVEKQMLKIPNECNKHFFIEQKEIYDAFDSRLLSYSGPTSIGKSFIIRVFIKDHIIRGDRNNYLIIVPTRALINECSSKIINDLGPLLKEKKYRVCTIPDLLDTEPSYNYIYVLTPERAFYLLLGNEELVIDYLFIDEAHILSSNDPRNSFYYKVIDIVDKKKNAPHIVFASPNIPNPGVYLEMVDESSITENLSGSDYRTAFSPVNQIKQFWDFVEHDLYVENDIDSGFVKITDFKSDYKFMDLLKLVGRGKQNLIYCNSRQSAIEFAREYASLENENHTNPELVKLAEDLKRQIHSDYYLPELLLHGVAYHIGYLPQTISLRIEELYKAGLINTVFCTSTLMEGVNLPADNLFVTDYLCGRSPLSIVDFKNLMGRVGRIDYNLYGNVFVLRLKKTTKREKYRSLVCDSVPEQKLSIIYSLKETYKKAIVTKLLAGEVDFKKIDNQTYRDYEYMRKQGLLLLNDILKDRTNTCIRRAFNDYLSDKDIEIIKDKFKDLPIDDDMNFSSDQIWKLNGALSDGLAYPDKRIGGGFTYNDIFGFLNKLYHIFRWDIYETTTIGAHDDNQNPTRLKWYAMLLQQWMNGASIEQIIDEMIEHKKKNPEGALYRNFSKCDFEDTQEDHNTVISDVLDAIQKILLFKISNYFLRFSNEYKKYHKISRLNNDWYEYIEFGTWDSVRIGMQKAGFSRECAAYIRSKHTLYKSVEGKLKVSKAVLQDERTMNEAQTIYMNIPEFFY